jgi:HK97 family phage major capsid protein
MSTPTLSKRATRELFRLQKEVEALIDDRGHRSIPQSTRKLIDARLAEMSNIRKSGRTGDEIREEIVDEMSREQEKRDAQIEHAHQQCFKKFLRGATESELRANSDLLAGQQGITWTQGPAGGFLVPQEFADGVVQGMSQYDPLLDPDVVTIMPSKDFSLRAYPVPGWDLSTFAAVKLNEAGQQVDVSGQGPPNIALPAASTSVLQSYTYRATLAASLEFEDDQESFNSVMAAINASS